MNIDTTTTNMADWKLAVKHPQWYYFRVQSTAQDQDLTTWKLTLLRALQQLRGVFCTAIEFDILESQRIRGNETVVRVHYDDRVPFAECLAAATIDDRGGSSSNEPACVRIVAQSASLQTIATTV
jgi:hypothetical protein